MCETYMDHSGNLLNAIPSHPDPPGWHYRHGNPIFACPRFTEAHRSHARWHREYARTGSRWNYRLLLARSAPGLFADHGVCAGDGGNYDPAIREARGSRGKNYRVTGFRIAIEYNKYP